jgi:hypothetical protein
MLYKGHIRNCAIAYAFSIGRCVLIYADERREFNNNIISSFPLCGLTDNFCVLTHQENVTLFISERLNAAITMNKRHE